MTFDVYRKGFTDIVKARAWPKNKNSKRWFNRGLMQLKYYWVIGLIAAFLILLGSYFITLGMKGVKFKLPLKEAIKISQVHKSPET
jgi:hypothetical protein